MATHVSHERWSREDDTDHLIPYSLRSNTNAESPYETAMGDYVQLKVFSLIFQMQREEEGLEFARDAPLTLAQIAPPQDMCKEGNSQGP